MDVFELIQYLAVSSLLDIGSRIALIVLLYRIWSNVLQLPPAEQGAIWKPVPLLAAFMIIVPLVANA